jgi:hypothetical protein
MIKKLRKFLSHVTALGDASPEKKPIADFLNVPAVERARTI